MNVRGIRGAITVSQNEKQDILDATSELLQGIIKQNQIHPEDGCSVFITMTQDLDSTFPASVVRNVPGWELVPLMCSTEIPVQNSLPRCIRFMLHVNTEKKQNEMIHIYLNDAVKLRPDLAD